MLSFKGVIKRGKEYSPYMDKNTPCPFLWERVLIDPSGDVRGCVSDIYNQSRIGTINEKSISEIWQGEPISTWRRLHLEGRINEVPACDGCVDLEYRSWNYNYFHALSKTVEK